MSSQQPSKRRGGNPAVVGLTVLIVVVVAAVLVYFAWRTIQPAPTPIAEILADLRTFDGQAVTIRGKVSNPINILLVKAYDVTDDSGTIKVVTQRGLPKAGETLTINGVVNELYSIAGVNYTVIIEPAADQP